VDSNRVEVADRAAREGGDYRFIYEIDDGVERIVVHVIEHRANAYRRR
jgi:mRNA-degrading endonuclease RelE of RelBE toxin-antitoxin system